MFYNGGFIIIDGGAAIFVTTGSGENANRVGGKFSARMLFNFIGDGENVSCRCYIIEL